MTALPAKYAAAAITRGAIEWIDLPLRLPAPGQALIKVRACALCTWETRTFAEVKPDAKPLLGGHEVSGEVVAIGPHTAASLQVGDRVAVRLMGECGTCRGCRTDGACVAQAMNAVDTGAAFGPAGLAEYLTIPVRQAVAVGRLDFADAALTEPVSCVLRSLDQAPLEIGDDVLVFGGGFMGVLHARLAQLRGARVWLAEPRADRRDLAPTGVAGVFNPEAGNFAAAVANATQGGPQAIFVTGGGAAALETALQLVVDGGTVVAFAAQYPPQDLAIGVNRLHHHEKRLVGVVAQNATQFYRAALALSRRVIDVSALVSARYPLERLEAALLAADGLPYRVVIEMPV